MTDEEALRNARADPDNQPTDEAFWADPRVRVVLPPRKEVMTIRIDPDVLAWFRREKGYQTRINAVLRTYMEAKLRAAQPAPRRKAAR